MAETGGHERQRGGAWATAAEGRPRLGRALMRCTDGRTMKRSSGGVLEVRRLRNARQKHYQGAECSIRQRCASAGRRLSAVLARAREVARRSQGGLLRGCRAANASKVKAACSIRSAARGSMSSVRFGGAGVGSTADARGLRAAAPGRAAALARILVHCATSAHTIAERTAARCACFSGASGGAQICEHAVSQFINDSTSRGGGSTLRDFERSARPCPRAPSRRSI